MRNVMLLLLVGCCIYSCKPKREKKLALNTMKEVMWDIVCADEWFAEEVARDSMLKHSNNFAKYQQVFDIHKVTEEDFSATFDYYQQHPDEFKILIDSVQLYGSRKRDMIRRAPLRLEETR